MHFNLIPIEILHHFNSFPTSILPVLQPPLLQLLHHINTFHFSLCIFSLVIVHLFFHTCNLKLILIPFFLLIEVLEKLVQFKYDSDKMYVFSCWLWQGRWSREKPRGRQLSYWCQESGKHLYAISSNVTVLCQNMFKR